MDAWGWEHLDCWLEVRVTMPVGALLCVLAGPTGDANLGITSIYLEGIDSSEIINAVHHRPAPVLPASGGLR